MWFLLWRGRTYSSPGVDAAVVGVLDEREGLVFVQYPGLPVRSAVGHGTEDDLGDLKTGLAESAK